MRGCQQFAKTSSSLKVRATKAGPEGTADLFESGMDYVERWKSGSRALLEQKTEMLSDREMRRTDERR